jgi:hypothetical protein
MGHLETESARARKSEMQQRERALACRPAERATQSVIAVASGGGLWPKRMTAPDSGRVLREEYSKYGRNRE